MTVTLQKPRYATRVAAPTSKSAAHRLLIAAAFADGETTVKMRASCADIDATVACLVALGAEITPVTGGLLVRPVARGAVKKGALLDCGESGSTLRFLLPVVAALGADATFLRHGRLPERPLAPLDAVLTAHGATLAENGAYLTVRGRIKAGEYEIAANVSSQYITGLLFALSLLDGPSTLTLTGRVESAPYIDLTCEALAAFGKAPTLCADGRRFFVESYEKLPLHSPLELTPEGDLSGAAFPLALGAIGTHAVTVTGLAPETKQGDAEILSLLARFGATVSQRDDAVTVSPAPLHGITIDATQIPDLVPILSVVAAAATGETRITGAARLRIKESDRLSAITAFLRTMGADVTELADGLIIRGGKLLRGGTLDLCGDHRIAMSAAVASLLTDEALVLPNAECVAKSYPTFFEDVIPIFG